MIHLRPAYAVSVERRSCTGARVGAGALTGAWNDDDLRTLIGIAEKNKISDPAFLLKVMASESGLQPNAANPLKNDDGNPAAVGLIQFTKVANGALGLTEAQRADMVNWSVADQLPYVDKYFSILPWTRAGNSYDTAAQVYEGVFAGGLMLSKGVSDDTVLYTEGVDGSAYSANKGFDVDGKGYITVGDLGKHLDFVAAGPVYREALDRLRSIGGTPSPSSSSMPWWQYALLGVAAAGVGVFLVAR